MKRKMHHGFLPAALLVAALSACSNVKEELGVGRNSPDEFTVIKRAPLTLPPDYNLRPPGDSAAVSPAGDAATQAKTTLLGKEGARTAEGAGEKTLLNKLGTGAADPGIRKQIDEDNGYIALQSRTVAEKLIFWDESAPVDKDGLDSVVDPQKEAARLKENKSEGKAVDEGAVPVIKKSQSTLDKIF
jgi:hypothetical protein